MPAARSKKKTEEPAGETRRFGMHPKLLLDVIRRQAGTLAKAILEGVMNSIDAGCKKCRVTITATRVVIQDDGKGLTERSEIENFFETFGQPHDESEGKVYGTFRMGRGQMFAYGLNVWRTGPFEMTVDVANKGLDYELKSGLSEFKGCLIEIALETPLLPSDLAETERTIRKWVEYAPATVVINDKQANTDPAKEKWDHVTPEAYVRLNRGGALSIYNLGVHTMDLGGYRFGTGGTVVSRQQLRVNFARNDIQSDCPVWKKLRPLIDANAKTKIARKVEMSDDERQRMCDLVAADEPPADAYRMRLFTAVNGRHFSAEQMCESNYTYARKLTTCPLGDRRGDRVFQQKLAFVLADVTLDRFDLTEVELNELLQKMKQRASGMPVKTDPRYLPYEIVGFATIAEGLSDKFDLVDEKDHTPVERLWLDLAQRGSWIFLRDQYERFKSAIRAGEMDPDELDTRKIRVGKSESADGWTDGETFVAIDREFLRTLTADVKGITDLGLLLLHEFCHEGPDTADHEHGHEFYEQFHHRAVDTLPEFVAGCLSRMPNVIKSAGRELPKTLLKNHDQREKIVRGLRGLLASAESAPGE